jgi:hypothetical protein
MAATAWCKLREGPRWSMWLYARSERGVAFEQRLARGGAPMQTSREFSRNGAGHPSPSTEASEETMTVQASRFDRSGMVT